MEINRRFCIKITFDTSIKLCKYIYTNLILNKLSVSQTHLAKILLEQAK